MTDRRIPPRRDTPSPPPPAPDHRPPLAECQIRDANGEPVCVRQLQNAPCGTCPDGATETTFELDETITVSCSPLTAEQEIRSDALGHAIGASQRYPGAEHSTTLLDLAEVFARWITTGRRP